MESQGQQRRIPRPRNSWMVFRQCVNRSEHLPDALRRCQKWLSAVTGPCWTALPEARKQIFEEVGKAEAEAHQRAYPGYKYQPARKAKKQGPLKNIDTEVRAGELAREPYERSAAALGSSLSGRRGTGTATASERGVAAKHAWYPDVLDVPLPQPQQAFTRTSTAVPPTLPSIRFPALNLVPHRSPIGTRSSVSSIASSWGWTTPDYPVPRAHEDWWPARTTVPLAPTPVPESLQQVHIGHGHPPEYFDWNYFSSS
ncbi:hypothetical protein DAEQUDRAFT_587822 [Daedalea quercina L-15889]|uniref:HMG box domain-containing protein n=1 Tax=Daedalea quercina L-15889 TaxID=1314783 RepID=A0A165SUK7_9APHY|nr:hypothetical protein DAEQUDRAFT_587822 [Daedalea quercina L-15889]